MAPRPRGRPKRKFEGERMEEVLRHFRIENLGFDEEVVKTVAKQILKEYDVGDGTDGAWYFIRQNNYQLLIEQILEYHQENNQPEGSCGAGNEVTSQIGEYEKNKLSMDDLILEDYPIQEEKKHEVTKIHGPVNDEVVDPTPHMQDRSTTTQQLELVQRLREVIEPESTMLSPPSIKINARARPAKRIKSNKVNERSTKREPSAYVEFQKKKQEANERKPRKGNKKAKLQKEDVDVDEACMTESVKMACKPCPLITLPISNEMLELNLPYVHPNFRDFVDEIIDVDADGNCGYRVVAVALGRHENEWSIIREDLCNELKGDLRHYDKVFLLDGYAATLATQVGWPLGKHDNNEYWMETPTMIWPIAERYNAVVSFFSPDPNGNNVTCFPTKRPPMTDAPLHIAILLRKDHYLYLKMKDNCPLPVLVHPWEKEAPKVSKENSKAWLCKFGSRLEEGKRLLSIE